MIQKKILRGDQDSIGLSWSDMRKQKGVILTTLLLTSLLMFIYISADVLPIQALYQSRCIIAPKDAGIENPFKTTEEDAYEDLSFIRWAEIEAILTSAELGFFIVRRHNMAPKLVTGIEPDADKAEGPSPALLKASQKLRKMLKVKWDDANKAVVLMGFSENPALCRQVLSYYLDGLDLFLRERARDIIDLQLILLKVQRIHEEDEKIRAGLELRIKSQLEKKLRVQNSVAYYSFNLVSEPTHPLNHSLPNHNILKYVIVPLNILLLSWLATMALFLMKQAWFGRKGRKPGSGDTTEKTDRRS
jgi:hypothetical protein